MPSTSTEPPKKSPAMTLDLDRLRAETPGVANRIHLNAASAALMPEPVIAAG